MANIKRAQADDFEAIKAFYRACGYGGGLNRQDLVLIAQSDEQIIG